MRAFMEKLALKTGAVLLKKFSQTRDVKVKGFKDLVTDADFAAEKVLLKALESGKHAAPVLSEENGGKWSSEETFWTIDPLDGTLNYAFGNPLFGLNIAYVQEGVATHGVSYLPYLEEMFYAEKGRGAFLNGRKITCPNRALEQSLIFCAWSKRTPEKDRQGLRYVADISHAALSIRDPGSTSLGLAYVACGRYGGYVYNNATPWDITAGSLLIQEAGGRVTDFDGKLWHPHQKTICAGNQQNHAELLKALQA
ncbi:inositol monophosphatase [Candidatus Micrarchaeota archaeon]|nr:inositol monophosphatase [Candidatus Micrarchaeota archaeon]